MTRQERFVWRLACKKSGPEKLETFKEIGFWMGYYFTLRDMPQRRWDELETVLRFKSTDVLAKLGYFDTIANCERVIQNFHSFESKLTLEDILMGALKSRGPREMKPLLYTILPKLEHKALAQKFYQYFIYLSLTAH